MSCATTIRGGILVALVMALSVRASAQPAQQPAPEVEDEPAERPQTPPPDSAPTPLDQASSTDRQTEGTPEPAQAADRKPARPSSTDEAPPSEEQLSARNAGQNPSTPPEVAKAMLPSDPDVRPVEESWLGLGKLRWDPAWPRFRWWEYVQTGALLALTPWLAAQTGPHVPGWTEPLIFEQELRDLMVFRSEEHRDMADHISDWLWYGTEAYPVIVDTLLVAGLARWSWDVAWQMLLMNAQAMTFTGLMARASHIFIGRDRPLGKECDDDPEYHSQCDQRNRFAGFFSGHTALAYTGAALTCVHHRYIPLYGGGVADIIPCAATMATATVTGYLRLANDKHYISDVIVGAFVGIASGYGLPWLLHYRHGKPQHLAKKRFRWVMMPYASANGGAGLQAMGSF